MSLDPRSLTIAVVGGTGAQGRGLARRFALAGVTTRIGSRDPDRARTAAEELNKANPPVPVTGAGNAAVCQGADLAIVAVPWPAHRSTLESLREPLAGLVVVDCVNPLEFDKRGPYLVDVPEGSAAEQSAALLGDSRVTAAFHHVSAAMLNDQGAATVDCDALVVGDDRDATDLVCALADLVPGMRGVYAGRLRLARGLEAFTANTLAVNRRYRVNHAGIRVTGV